MNEGDKDTLFMYQSTFVSQLLELIYWMVTIFVFDGVTLQTSYRNLKKQFRSNVDIHWFLRAFCICQGCHPCGIHARDSWMSRM